VGNQGLGGPSLDESPFSQILDLSFSSMVHAKRDRLPAPLSDKLEE
jgi:hypothetical protein